MVDSVTAPVVDKRGERGGMEEVERKKGAKEEGKKVVGGKGGILCADHHKKERGEAPSQVILILFTLHIG